MSCGGGGFWRRGLFGALAFLLFLWFVCFEVITSGGTATATATAESFKQSVAKNRASSVSHTNLDLNYVSKRRVPNGPDPIHNRRAGKSRQPPGRA